MSSTSDFAQRFSELINGESFTSVGEKIGLSKQTVSAYISGVRSPKRPTIQAIANFYGVNPAWLIGLDAPKYAEKKPTPVSESGPLYPPGYDLLTPEQKEIVNRLIADLAKNHQSGE